MSTCPCCGADLYTGSEGALEERQAIPAEPPVGTWVRDRFGGVSHRGKGGGWGEPGLLYLAKWEPMWEARGPLVECGPWGRAL